MLITRSMAYNALLDDALSALGTLPEAKELDGKAVMITGAGGMIGSFLADLLMRRNKKGGSCRVIATGRSMERLKARFADYEGDELFLPLEWDVTQPLGELNYPVDYIIHAASNADPASFAKYPADTIMANIAGTVNLLKLCTQSKVKRFLFVSSGEYYGRTNEKLDDFTEDYLGWLDFSTSRVCYPEGKRAAEAICRCYFEQYGVSTVTVRPCHVFGATMTASDSRVLSLMLRSAAAGDNILLKSPGNIERSQCGVSDAAAGILTALLRGKSGEAYNISDKAYELTIRGFAEQAAAAGGVRVVFEKPEDALPHETSRKVRQVLDNGKLLSLGWAPTSGDKIAQSLEILRELT